MYISRFYIYMDSLMLFFICQVCAKCVLWLPLCCYIHIDKASEKKKNICDLK